MLCQRPLQSRGEAGDQDSVAILDFGGTPIIPPRILGLSEQAGEDRAPRRRGAPDAVQLEIGSQLVPGSLRQLVHRVLEQHGSLVVLRVRPIPFGEPPGRLPGIGPRGGACAAGRVRPGIEEERKEVIRARAAGVGLVAPHGVRSHGRVPGQELVDPDRPPRRWPVGAQICGVEAGVDRLLVGRGQIPLLGVQGEGVTLHGPEADPIAGAVTAIANRKAAAVRVERK